MTTVCGSVGVLFSVARSSMDAFLATETTSRSSDSEQAADFLLGDAWHETADAPPTDLP